MPVRTARPTIGTTRVLLASANSATVSDMPMLTVKNPTGSTGTIYLGGDDVTTANGLALPAGESFTFDNLGPGDSVYAIASADTDIQTLRTRA